MIKLKLASLNKKTYLKLLLKENEELKRKNEEYKKGLGDLGVTIARICGVQI